MKDMRHTGGEKMEQAKKKFRISFNAPAVLAFTLAAVMTGYLLVWFIWM